MLLEADEENLKRIVLGRILCIDYGLKRVGLALSDPSQMLASSYRTIVNNNKENLIQDILFIIEEQGTCAVVIGKPLHMDGTLSKIGESAQSFASEMSQKIDIPIFLWDERWTTQSAKKMLIETGRSTSKNRDAIDRIAAAFLLQSFLDRLSYLRRF